MLTFAHKRHLLLDHQSDLLQPLWGIDLISPEYFWENDIDLTIAVKVARSSELHSGGSLYYNDNHPPWFCTLPKIMQMLSINTFSDIHYEMVEETNPKEVASVFKFLCWIRSVVSIELWLTGEMNSTYHQERNGPIGLVRNGYCLMRRQAFSEFLKIFRLWHFKSLIAVGCSWHLWNKLCSNVGSEIRQSLITK